MNNGASAAQAQLKFFDESGSALVLPLAFPQGAVAAQRASAVNQTIRAGGELVIESQGAGR